MWNFVFANCDLSNSTLFITIKLIGWQELKRFKPLKKNYNHNNRWMPTNHRVSCAVEMRIWLDVESDGKVTKYQFADCYIETDGDINRIQQQNVPNKWKSPRFFPFDTVIFSIISTEHITINYSWYKMLMTKIVRWFGEIWYYIFNED